MSEHFWSCNPRFPRKAPNEILPFTSFRYPAYASTKFDGFRLLSLGGGQLLSPALKPFPNLNLFGHLANILGIQERNQVVFDGELWSPQLTFQELQSILRSRSKPIPSHLCFYVFDAIPASEWNTVVRTPFSDRVQLYHSLLWNSGTNSGYYPVVQTLVDSPDEAKQMFESALERGEEGIMLAEKSSLYKHGRYTPLECGLYKYKEFETHDAVILDIEIQRQMRPDLPRTLDSQGRLIRSYRDSDYILDTKIGAFWVDFNGTRFKVTAGRGFTNEDKWRWYLEWEKDQNFFKGKHIEFTYMPHGTKDRPRIGKLKRFRPDKD